MSKNNKLHNWGYFLIWPSQTHFVSSFVRTNYSKRCIVVLNYYKMTLIRKCKRTRNQFPLTRFVDVCNTKLQEQKIFLKPKCSGILWNKHQGKLKGSSVLPNWKGFHVCFPGVITHCGCILHSPVAGFSLLVFPGFLITHNDTPQSVGLLWTSDQSVAQTSTWKHTTLTTDKHPCPRWDSNPRSQQTSGLRPTPQNSRPLRPAKGVSYSSKNYFADCLCAKKSRQMSCLWVQDTGHGQPTALAV